MSTEMKTIHLVQPSQIGLTNGASTLQAQGRVGMVIRPRRENASRTAPISVKMAMQRNACDYHLMLAQLRRVRSLRMLPYPHKANLIAIGKHARQSLGKGNSATHNDLQNSSHHDRNLDWMVLTSLRQQRLTTKSTGHLHLLNHRHQEPARLTSDPLRISRHSKQRCLLSNRARRGSHPSVRNRQTVRNGTVDPHRKMNLAWDHQYHYSHPYLDRVDPLKEPWHLLPARCLSEVNALIAMA